MDLGLVGKSYCVVGGTRGIGREVTRLLLAEGANVAVISRNAVADTAQPVDALVKSGRAIAIPADITVPGAAKGAICEAHEEFGSLDGLTVTTHGNAQSPAFADMSDQEWERQFADVMLGPVRCARAILPFLIAQRSGQIVMTAAYSARAPGAAITGYAAMKAALVNLTKALAKAHGRDGVRVNAVCPGFICTDRAQARIGTLVEKHACDRAQAEKMLLASTEMSPALDRLGTPAEVAEMIVFLLSARASYTSGMIANVDGGTDF